MKWFLRSMTDLVIAAGLFFVGAVPLSSSGYAIMDADRFRRCVSDCLDQWHNPGDIRGDRCLALCNSYYNTPPKSLNPTSRPKQTDKRGCGVHSGFFVEEPRCKSIHR
jgi:hypothetical protein